jgi:hypothetical protein
MKGSHNTQINHKRYGERPSAIASSRASFGLLICVFLNALFRGRPQGCVPTILEITTSQALVYSSSRLSVSFYNEAGRLSSVLDVMLGFPFIVHPAAINMIAASCRFTIALSEFMFIVSITFLSFCNCSVISLCSTG